MIGEDDLSFAILDINPFSRGHCLVLPKRHVRWWHELTEAENTSLFSMAKKVADRMMKVLNPDFVCIYARGRRIPPHSHLPGTDPQRGCAGQVFQRFADVPGISPNVDCIEGEPYSEGGC